MVLSDILSPLGSHHAYADRCREALFFFKQMVRICTPHSLTEHRLPPLYWTAPELLFVASTYSATSAYLRNEPVGIPASPTPRVFAISLSGDSCLFCPPLRHCRLKLLSPRAIAETCWNFGSVVCASFFNCRRQDLNLRTGMFPNRAVSAQLPSAYCRWDNGSSATP